MNTLNTLARIGKAYGVLGAILLLALPHSGLADPLFDNKETLDLSLKADFKTMFAKKDKTQQYPGELTLREEAGEHHIDVMLELRGNFRLKNCQVPGLRLIFPKQKEGLFAHQKKLKLVAQCRRKGDQYQDYLVQEYATYQAYEALTEHSFRTRLATVTYTDSGSNDSSWTNFGFLIEDKGRMVKRLGMKPVSDNRISRTDLKSAETNLATMYQFLVGNTDFSLLKGEGDEPCCHNAKLIDAGDGFVPVLYDFDLAGIINTRYAAPPVNLGIDKVTQRLYRGFCKNNEVVPSTLAHIESNRDALYAAFLNENIREKTRKKMEKYLGKFFNLAAKPGKVKVRITGKCR